MRWFGQVEDASRMAELVPQASEPAASTMWLCKPASPTSVARMTEMLGSIQRITQILQYFKTRGYVVAHVVLIAIVGSLLDKSTS